MHLEKYTHLVKPKLLMLIKCKLVIVTCTFPLLE